MKTKAVCGILVTFLIMASMVGMVNGETASANDDTGDVSLSIYDYLDIKTVEVVDNGDTWDITVKLAEAPDLAPINIEGDESNASATGVSVQYQVIIGNDTLKLQAIGLPNIGSEGGFVYTKNFDETNPTPSLSDVIDGSNNTMNETEVGSAYIEGDTIHLSLNTSYFGTEDAQIFVVSSALKDVTTLVATDDASNVEYFAFNDTVNSTVITDEVGDVVNGEGIATYYDYLDIKSIEAVVENGTEGQWINVTLTLAGDASQKYTEVSGEDYSNIEVEGYLDSYTISASNGEKIVMAVSINVLNESVIAFYTMNASEDEIPDPSQASSMADKIYVNTTADMNETAVGLGKIVGDKMYVYIKPGVIPYSENIMVMGIATTMDLSDITNPVLVAKDDVSVNLTFEVGEGTAANETAPGSGETNETGGGNETAGNETGGTTGNETGEETGGDEKESGFLPGFEVVVALSAIVAVFILRRRE